MCKICIYIFTAIITYSNCINHLSKHQKYHSSEEMSETYV